MEMCLGNVLFQERQFAQIEFLSFFLQHTDFVFLLYSRQNMITIITTPVITVVILNSDTEGITICESRQISTAEQTMNATLTVAENLWGLQKYYY